MATFCQQTVDPNIVLPFYWERFKAKTTHLTTIERGGYLALLLHQWQYGFIPGANLQRLAVIVGCGIRTIWPQLSPFFAEACDCKCGNVRNRRLEEVRQEQIANIARGRTNGKLGGRPKKKPNENLDLNLNHNQDANQESTQNSNLEKSLPSSEIREPEIVQNTERSELGKPHPVRDLLAYHDRCFFDRYGDHPAKYTAKDAKHAKDLLDAHGEQKARQLVDALFESRDPWIAKSGHGMGILFSAQNKLIAELSGRAPAGDGLDGLREFVRG